MTDSVEVENFLGCGAEGCEHRTTGGRAWCHDCREWCYPDAPCVRGEVVLYGWWLAEARRWAEMVRRELGAAGLPEFPWETAKTNSLPGGDVE